MVGTSNGDAVTKPVFGDESGRRAAVLLWVGRAVIAICGVLAAALALTMTTHIALPGLDGLVSPTLNQSRPEIKVAEDADAVPRDARQSTKEGTSSSTEPTERRTRAGSTKPKAKTASEVTGAAAVASPRTTSSATRTSSAPTSAADAKAANSARGQGVGRTVNQGRGIGTTSHPTAAPKKKNP
jgi:hypothetical protein